MAVFVAPSFQMAVIRCRTRQSFRAEGGLAGIKGGEGCPVGWRSRMTLTEREPVSRSSPKWETHKQRNQQIDGLREGLNDKERRE